jgi:FMN reductase
VNGESRHLVAISAGLGQPSSTRLLADRLLSATEGSLSERGLTASTEVVELRDLAQDLVNHLLTGFPSQTLREVIDRTVAADGIVAVTPIFNASYSGLFKVFWDVLDRDRLVGMPVIAGATGGTARHSLALEHAVRPLFAYLGADVMPTAVFAAAEDWGRPDRPADEELPERIARAGDQLAHAVASRQARTVSDPFVNPVPFEELLGGRDPR